MWLLTLGLGLLVGGEATRRTTVRRVHSPSVTGPCR
jgi:hypothetical protein